MSTLAPSLPRAWARRICSLPARPWVTAIAVLLFLCAVLIVSRRTLDRLVIPGAPTAAAYGFVDFRDAIYYPVVAFLDGNNPYDPTAYAAKYPVGNVFPLYSPMLFLVHLPFGVLPFMPSAAAYFFVTVALMVCLAYVTLRMGRFETSAAAVFGLAFAILISQPGQWNLFLGQCAAPIALAVYGALRLARRRPWLGGLCFAVASFKPTTGVPLALLMFARGDHLAVLVGVVLAAGVGGLLAVPIIRGAGGASAFWASLHGNYAAFAADPTAAASTSPYRVDVVALVSRLLGRPVGPGIELTMVLGVLGLCAVALRRLAEREHDDDRLLSASLVCVAVLVCVYHQSYEALLLALPLLVAAHRCLAEDVPGSRRHWLLLATVAVPAGNYLIMGGVVSRMATGGTSWLVATSLDGVALLVALGVLCALAWSGDEGALARPTPYVSGGSVR